MMMQEKTYLLTVGIIFSVIAVLHLLRIIGGWGVSMGDWDVPYWVSWVALIVAGYLGYTGFNFGKK